MYADLDLTSKQPWSDLSIKNKTKKQLKVTSGQKSLGLATCADSVNAALVRLQPYDLTFYMSSYHVLVF